MPENDINSPTSQSKAIAWSAVERFSTQGIQFVVSVIVARLVAPSCYGLVAMLSIFVAIGQSLIDSGFSNALIHKKNCTEKDYSTVFLFNIAASTVLYALFYIISPYIAEFYEQPDLVMIARYVTLTFFFNSFSIVQRTKLTKSLDFKKLSSASIVSVIISGIVGIVMAFLNYGVWALVFQGLVMSLVNTIVLCSISQWKPTWTFSKESYHELFSFGSKIMLTGLISTIYINLYSLVIGKFFSSVQLGYFNKMQRIATFPSKNLTAIISRAVYPKQCMLQDKECDLVENYSKLFSLSSYIIFPVMMGLSILAQPLTYCLLGENWSDAYPYLQILCLVYMFDHLQFFNWQMLAVKGRSDLSLKSEIIKKIVSVVIMVVTIPMGIEAMIWGLLLYAICDLMIIIPFVHYLIPEITFIKEMRLLYRPFCLSLAMAICMYVSLCIFRNSYVQLFFSSAIGFIVYYVLSVIVKAQEYYFFRDKIRSFIR